MQSVDHTIRRPRRQVRWGWESFLVLMTLAVALAFHLGFVEVSLENTCNVVSLLVLAVLIGVYRCAPRGIWSVSMVYLGTFAVFHFGLTAPLGLGFEPTGELGLAADRWLYRPSAIEAVWLALVGLAACGVGMGLGFRFKCGASVASKEDDHVSWALGGTGFLLVLAATTYWFLVVVQTGGWSLLTKSYGDLLYLTRGTPLHWAYYALGVGLAFLAASEFSKLHVAALAIFGAMAAFAFPLGLRGQILFPTFAFLAVIAKKRIPLSARRTVVLAVILLSAISLVRGLRQVGIASAHSVEVSINPLDGLMELGSSLRPVAETIRWHQRGDEYLYGASYWAPFDRALYYVVPGWSRPPAEWDDRILNVVVERRVGLIGFSPVAEGYHNFGSPGVVLVMFLTGLLLGWADMWPNRPQYQAALGIVFVSLLYHVRNSFVSVPSHCLMGLLLFALVAFIAHMQRSREGRGPIRGSAGSAERSPRSRSVTARS